MDDFVLTCASMLFQVCNTKMNSTDLSHFMAAVRDEFYKSQAYSQSSANGG